jgi:segregation and condensation protein A
MSTATPGAVPAAAERVPAPAQEEAPDAAAVAAAASSPEDASATLPVGPVARVLGVDWLELPTDLYIPPDALEVVLEAFEGPLDLLLYLIRRQNMDVLDIPIAQVTEQYMQYVSLMKEIRLELAAEYLVMAAMLAEIKSRMLLPRPASLAEEEADPRADLVRRLQEYERYKRAAESLDERPRMDRDLFPVLVDLPELPRERPQPIVHLDAILVAMREVLERARLNARHQIRREPLSVRARMSAVLERLGERRFVSFTALFTVEEGRAGVVVTLLAILELLKQAMIEIVLDEGRGTLHVKVVA